MSMLDKYSQADIENAQEMTGIFPVGLVPVYIKDVQEKKSKQGNDMLVITFAEINGAGAVINDYIVDNEFAVRKIKTLEKCFDIPYGSKRTYFIFREGVVHTEVETYNGFNRAKVVGYCKYDKNARYENALPRNDSRPVQEPPPAAPQINIDNVPF